MSEQKPMCPYCGAEMKIVVNELYDGAFCCGYAYCPKCGSYGPSLAGDISKEQAHDEVKAATLRRPLQKPLTLEELNECDIFYIEFRDLNEGNFIPVQFSPESHFKGMLTYHRPGWATHFSVEMFGCGRYWRCWASRPTIEERAAAPWEE